MIRLYINRAPIGVSLQDAGRKGYLRYGVSSAGPMDWVRHALANAMLGKPWGETCIEVGPAGLSMTVESGSLQFAFAGPGFVIRCDKQKLYGPLRFSLEAGQTLDIEPGKQAMWGYLGFNATPNVEKVLGSHAENRVGGIYAHHLEPGSSLELKESPVATTGIYQYIDPYLGYEGQAIEIIPASQYDHFSEQMKSRLVDTVLSLSNRFDRMAYQIEGAQIACDRGYDILSDGVTMGAIQVPGDGRPFVLMADHQPTGGYPKLACVCKADLPRIAQMPPGRPFRLKWTSLERALQRWGEMKRQIENLKPLRGRYRASEE